MPHVRMMIDEQHVNDQRQPRAAGRSNCYAIGRIMSLLAICFTVFLLTSSLLAQSSVAIGDFTWLPITEEDRNLKAPKVDKNAGAEAVFWRTHVWDEASTQDWRRIYSHYARIKVFNEKGKEKVSTVDIVTFRKDTAVTDIAARTIKPDGSIVEMNKDAIQDRNILRAGGISVRAKSFTLPAVEPGSIIEYRYREIAFKENIFYLRGHFQHEVPVQKSIFFIRPLSRDIVPFQMGLRVFNCEPSKVKLENNGFNSISLDNVPAFESEPYMPAEADVRPWILIYYAEDSKREPDKYWQKQGKEAYTAFKNAQRLNNEIKAAAAKAVSGASSDDQKVVALITWLRQNMRELFSSTVTDAERGKIIQSMPKTRRRTSTEVFESGIGTSDELNTLFAALAQSAGLDARPALVSSRNDLAFHPNLPEVHFLNSIDMAVKIGANWKLFDVSMRELPPDMISWKEEGVKALVTDSKSPTFIDSPVSPPEASQSARNGKFRLSADGTLEGDVKLSYTGHRAAERRQGRIGEPNEKLVESFKESLVRLYPGAEFSAITVANMDESSKPLEYSYHIKMPNYAQRTGRRLFFAPLYFQRTATPMFSAGERKHDIHIPFAWKETDDISIQLPEGYELDNPQAPESGGFGEVGGYKVDMGINKTGLLRVQRELIFGAKGLIFFRREAYPKLKNALDETHRRDGTMLALKQAAAK